jgi:aminoglycoside/choline kinase family phosphotransferase
MELRDPDLLLQQSRCCVPGWATAALEIALIEKGGSDRSYYRVTANGKNEGPESVIVMVYTDRRPDNSSFFPATEALSLSGARAPKIFHHDAPEKLAWIEDLGHRDLWEHRLDDENRLCLYQSALRQVARLHRLKWEDIPEHLRAQMQSGFDEKLYRWEQNYFFDQFAVRFSAADPERLQEIREKEEFAALAGTLGALPRSPVHRDFQSQNVIVREGKTWMIDYQGLRPGRPEYDVASLLYDPYVSLSAEERRMLRDYYFELRREDGSDCSEEVLSMCACQRLMQALGAYGKLGVVDGKTAFLRHITPAVENLCVVLHDSGLLPSLLEVLTLREDALQNAGLTDPL